MTEQLRNRANDILSAVLELPETERKAYVDQACSNDAALHAMVLGLLSKLDQLDDYMEHTAPFVSQLGRPAFVAPQPGERIGNWLVVRELGRGGMGVILLVERDDGSVRQTAALKIIQDGAASDIQLTRFHSERQILANLNHPDIARLIDAGSTLDGRPYFVMEYSDGVPIDQYCAGMQLSVAQRIALFARVCQAVHYAHQHLIIHRDLKPANILVGNGGEIKLLDFGIAKLQQREPDDSDTGAASWLLTPMYASPEQLAGTALTISTDIYSLGVVLYGLLTGRSPYASLTGTASDMLRQQQAQAPTRPSQAVTGDGPGAKFATGLASDKVLETGRRLSRQLRGDLDNILLKAIHTVPEQRYASADAFQRDLTRFLNGEPVHAVTPSWWYRANKVVLRYPWSVAAAALAAVSLVLGSGVALWKAREAEQAQAVAEKRFDQTHKLARTMVFDVNDTLEKGPTAAREKLVATALAYMQELAGDATLKPELKRDVASAYERLGDIAGNPVGANLGRTKDAQAYYNQALALRTSMAGTGPAALEDVTGLREVHQRLGDIAWGQGDVAAAQQHYDAATAAASEVFRRSAKPADQIEWFSRRRYSAAILFSRGQPNAGKLPEAIAQFAALRTDLDSFMRKYPDNTDVIKVVVPVLSQSVDLARVTGDLATARSASMLSLALTEKKLRDTPDDPRWRRQLGVTLRQVGDIAIELGDYDTGIARIRAALALRESVAAADPSNERAARDVAIGRSALADALFATEAYADAQKEYASARDTFAKQSLANPANAGLFGNLLQLEYGLAGAYFAGDEDAAALATLDALGRRLAAATNKPDDGGMLEAKLALLRAQIEVQQPALRAASYAAARKAVTVMLEQSESDPLDVYLQRSSAVSWQKVGDIGLSAGEKDSACAYMELAAGRYASLAAKKQRNAPDLRLQEQVADSLKQCRKG